MHICIASLIIIMSLSMNDVSAQDITPQGESLTAIVAEVEANLNRKKPIDLAASTARLRIVIAAHPGERSVYNNVAQLLVTLTAGLPDDPEYLPAWQSITATALEPKAALSFTTTDDKMFVIRRQSAMARDILNFDFTAHSKLIPAELANAERTRTIKLVWSFLHVVQGESVVNYSPQMVYLNGLSPSNLKTLADMDIFYYPGTAATTIENLDARNLVLKWVTENEQKNFDNQYQQSLREISETLQPLISRMAKPILSAGGPLADSLREAVRGAGLPEH